MLTRLLSLLVPSRSLSWDEDRPLTAPCSLAVLLEQHTARLIAERTAASFPRCLP